MDLMTLASCLIADPTLGDVPAMRRLVDSFAAAHPGVAAIQAANAAKSSSVPLEAWIASQRGTKDFDDLATDLTLSVLFGAVYVDRKVFDTPDPDPAWAFIGRFWSFVAAHPLALSAGPFGHWRYPPGGAR